MHVSKDTTPPYQLDNCIWLRNRYNNRHYQNNNNDDTTVFTINFNRRQITPIVILEFPIGIRYQKNYHILL